jgi:hypothetical protein
MFYTHFKPWNLVPGHGLNVKFKKNVVFHMYIAHEMHNIL